MAKFPLTFDARLSVSDWLWLQARAAKRGESVSATLRDAIAAARRIDEATYEGDQTSLEPAEIQSAGSVTLENR